MVSFSPGPSKFWLPDLQAAADVLVQTNPMEMKKNVLHVPVSPPEGEGCLLSNSKETPLRMVLATVQQVVLTKEGQEERGWFCAVPSTFS